MSHNTKLILTDFQGRPIPQYWNPETGSYEPLRGAHGGNRVLLYDANGNPIATMEYYGATLGERPAATDVPVGAVYTAVQTQESWQSDGTEWVAIGAVVMIGGQLAVRRGS